jgi:hypothetical protein
MSDKASGQTKTATSTATMSLSESDQPSGGVSSISRWIQAHPALMLVMLSLFVGILVLALGGYFLGWNWTGFKGNTFWDWMSLLITPVTLAAVSILFSLQQGQQSLAVTRKQQEDAAFESYCEHISHLLLESHLLDATPDSPVRAVARARTAATLHRLGQDHQAALLRFLEESGLTAGEAPVLDLSYLQS